MKLSEHDAKLFYDLMWALQYFVNQKRGVVADVESVEDYAGRSFQEKKEVRKALYENLQLIDAFVQENPGSLSDDDLSIVSKWKMCIQGEFTIERMLKKYAVFIKGRDVYGVLGLQQGLDEIVPRSRLPLYVRAVLLPFKGRIIYDGLFEPYDYYFGGGIKGELREIYMAAKQTDRIVESLDAEPKEPKKANKEKSRKAARDRAAELDALAEKARKLRASADLPAICSPAFSLVKASLEFACETVEDFQDSDRLDLLLRKV